MLKVPLNEMLNKNVKIKHPSSNENPITRNIFENLFLQFHAGEKAKITKIGRKTLTLHVLEADVKRKISLNNIYEKIEFLPLLVKIDYLHALDRSHCGQYGVMYEWKNVNLLGEKYQIRLCDDEYEILNDQKFFNPTTMIDLSKINHHAPAFRENRLNCTNRKPQKGDLIEIDENETLFYKNTKIETPQHDFYNTKEFVVIDTTECQTTIQNNNFKISLNNHHLIMKRRSLEELKNFKMNDEVIVTNIHPKLGNTGRIIHINGNTDTEQFLVNANEKLLWVSHESLKKFSPETQKTANTIKIGSRVKIKDNPTITNTNKEALEKFKGKTGTVTQEYEYNEMNSVKFDSGEQYIFESKNLCICETPDETINQYTTSKGKEVFYKTEQQLKRIKKVDELSRIVDSKPVTKTGSFML